ncbi:DegT/DnrJ/EryC1/StrS family aminotransferase [bacterium]|nr:DegT/DnrJ/EryC1/StrS family aminotransferase [bacterium]
MSDIPLFNLPLLHAPIIDEISENMQSVVSSGLFVGGPEIARFEQEFTKIARLPYAASVSSGTDALVAALVASGVQSGDFVVTVPMTFIATVEAIYHVGATPLFVDIDKNGVMDGEKLTELLKTTDKRIGAVIPVHLHGVMAEMRRITAICLASNIPVIEDAAQAHGAMREGVAPGELSLFATYSFYPGKNLGAFGDAGAVVSTSESGVEQIKALRNHGRYDKKYEHERIGYNMRMDAVQAAVLRVKIKYFPRWQREREEIANKYYDYFNESGIINHLPVKDVNIRSAWHLFTILHKRRDELQKALKKRGIQTGIHYPIPLHLQKACESLGYKEGDFPVAEQFAQQTLSIPFWPGMSDEHISTVAEAILQLL